MKTKLLKSFTYNGIFISSQLLATPREVEVLGVMVPPDPGFITILDEGKQVQVPTLVLENAPKIDWNMLITKEQERIRDNGLGFLVSNGGFKQSLLPLSECPIKENNEKF